MPIVSVCPYCNRGRIRARVDALGTTAKCPGCGSEFTVIPSEDSVLNAAGSLSPSSASSVPSVYAKDAPPAAVRLTSSICPAGRRNPARRHHRPGGGGRLGRSRRPARPGEAAGDDRRRRRARRGGGWAIPDFGRLVWLGMAVVAVAVGGWSLLAADRRRLFAWIGLGAGGGSLLLCLLLPWALGEGWWPERGYNADEAVAVGENGEMTDGRQLIDPAKATWAKNGMRVRVVEARRGADVTTKPAAGKKSVVKSVPAFVVVVEVANDGCTAAMPFTGWGAGAAAELQTAGGGKVPAKTFTADVLPPPGVPSNARPLTTGTNTQQTLYFEPLPGDAGGRGTLELSPDAFGGTGDPIRFSVPFPDVSWQATPTGGTK